MQTTSERLQKAVTIGGTDTDTLSFLELRITAFDVKRNIQLATLISFGVKRVVFFIWEVFLHFLLKVAGGYKM